MTRQLQMYSRIMTQLQPGQPPACGCSCSSPGVGLGGGRVSWGGQRAEGFLPHTAREALQSSEAQDLIHFSGKLISHCLKHVKNNPKVKYQRKKPPSRVLC